MCGQCNCVRPLSVAVAVCVAEHLLELVGALALVHGERGKLVVGEIVGACVPCTERVSRAKEARCSVHGVGSALCVGLRWRVPSESPVLKAWHASRMLSCISSLPVPPLLLPSSAAAARMAVGGR